MRTGFSRARKLGWTGVVLGVLLGVALVPAAPALTRPVGSTRTRTTVPPVSSPPASTPPASTSPATGAPVPPAPTTFSFAFGGDMGYNRNAAATIKGIAAAGVDFSLHLGDMAYDQIYPEERWCDFIKDPRNGVGPDFPYQIVTGGHDLGKGPGPAAQYRTLIDKYTACLPDRMGSTGTYGKEYYFDHPKPAPLMRVIMISPSITTPDGITWDYRPGTRHWQWLSDAIDGARAAGIRWVAVGMARNCISTGEKRCEIGRDLFNLLVDKRVDLILQAHEHGYARSRQLSTGPDCPAIPVNKVDPRCFADDGTSDNYVKGEGPVVVIAGTLGIGLRPMNPKDSEAGAFRAIMGSNLNRTHGFVKVTVNPERLQAQFIATTKGGFSDQFAVIDPHPESPPTSTPTTTTTTTTPPSTTETTVPDRAPGDSLTATLVRPRAGSRAGYWMLGADGSVYSFGAAAQFGAASLAAGRRAVDFEPTPSGQGAWVLDDTGGVTALGDAPSLGSVTPVGWHPGEVPTSLSATPSGGGYLVFTNRGRVLPFGDARSQGDMSAVPLNGPVLDSVITPTGLGYYMVASDGGIFAFGDARFAGSMGGTKLNRPVESLVPDGDGDGYWLVASDGGVFAFDAPYRGSMGGTRLARPVTGMVRYGDGYLMVGEDGGIFNFSNLGFLGSLGATPPARPVVAVAALP